MANKPVKIIKLITHIIIITVLLYLFKINKTKIKSKVIYERFAQDIRHVLLWTNIKEIDKEGQQIFFNKPCQFTNCYMTTNRELLDDIRMFDAIVFNSEHITSDLPTQRSKHQKYIFFSKASAERFPICDKRFDNYFNWSWTYKSNSEIKIKFYSILNVIGEDIGGSVYFKWLKNMKDIDKSFKEKLKGKSKAAAWIVDNCKTLSKRENFVEDLRKELSKYNLGVDVFGKCGELKCKRKTMAACYWKLKRSYYFYLALEDSFDSDFVSDVVVHAYESNTVPVVYGGANYSKFLPPGSYLDGSKLGPKDTAKKIYEAMKNKQTYYNYFKWKNHYIIRPNENIVDVCEMCQKLNSLEWLNYKMIYTDFRLWWNPVNEKCLTDTHNLLK